MDINSSLIELIQNTPFGGFLIICLIIMTRHFNKQLQTLTDLHEISIKEIKSAYVNANKKNNKK